MTPDPLAVLPDRPPTTDTPTLRLPVLDSSVYRARHTTQRMLAGLVPAGHLDDVLACVSELVTNALGAARTYAEPFQFGWSYAATPIHLTVTAQQQWTRLDVRDPNPSWSEPSPGDLLDEHGKGLVIVDALSARRWETLTDSDKTIHAIVPMPLVKLTDDEIAVASR